MKRSILALILVLMAVSARSDDGDPDQTSDDSAFVRPSHLTFSSTPVLNPTFLPVYLVDTVLLWSSNAPATYTYYVKGNPGSFVSLNEETRSTNCGVIVKVYLNYLEVGLYSDTVKFFVEGVDTPVELTVDLEITPDSAWVNPSHLHYELEPVPESTTVPICLNETVFLESSNAPAAYSYSILGGDESFVSVTRSSGLTNDSLEISICLNGLELGWHDDTVVFTIEGVSSQPRLAVNLRIEEQEDGAWVEPPELLFTGQEVTVQTVAPVYLRDTVCLRSTNAPASYRYFITGGSSSFVSTSGHDEYTDDSIEVSVCLSGLEPGTYTDSVVFFVDGFSTAVELPITLVVTEAGGDSAWVEPSQLSFTFDKNTGTPQQDTVHIYSTNAPASYSCYPATGSNSFVSIPDSSGLTNESVVLVVDPTGLAAGYYWTYVIFDVLGCDYSAQVDVLVEIIPADSTHRRIRNQPNPFNPSTTIYFSLKSGADVNLTVYDVLGRKVTCLHSGWLPAGGHHVMWDGTDDTGETVGSGVYLYRLEYGNEVETNKMVLIK